MKREKIETLIEASERPEGFAISTVRYPKEVDLEMRRFLREHPYIKLATLLRECVILGWLEMNKENGQT